MILQELIVPLLLDKKKYEEGLDEAKKKTGSLAGGLASLGAGVVAGGIAVAGAGIAALGVGINQSIDATTNWAGELDSIQDILGGTATESSGLAVMMNRIGGSSDQVTGALAKMTMGLENAAGDGLGPTGLALQKLGISAYDSNGKIKNAYELFGEVSNVLGPMEDGLDKTGLMMEIFGKSGKDLGDAMSAAANGGMTQFQQEAKNMGLAIDPSKVIEMQKSQAKLDQTLMGLKVTAGGFLIPVLQKLADTLSKVFSDPQIQVTISNLASGIATFAGAIIDKIPLAIDIFMGIVNFLTENEGIIIGVLAGLGAAISVWVYSTVIPAIVAAITASAPIIGAVLAIAAVVALLYTAWDKNFLGIRDTITKFYNDSIKPIFEKLKEWLEVNIPKAIEWLKEKWETVLLPALQRVYEFLKTYVFPLFKAVGDFLGAVFGYVLKVIGAIITEKIVPALKSMYGWLKENVFPIIEKIAKWVGEKLSPAFEGLKETLKSVTDWFKNMAESIKKLSLPKWLTPGSPTPLEIAMRGLNKELQKSAMSIVPQFSASLNMNTRSPLSTISSNNNNSEIIEAMKNINTKPLDEKTIGRLFETALVKVMG